MPRRDAQASRRGEGLPQETRQETGRVRKGGPHEICRQGLEEEELTVMPVSACCEDPPASLALPSRAPLSGVRVQGPPLAKCPAWGVPFRVQGVRCQGCREAEEEVRLRSLPAAARTPGPALPGPESRLAWRHNEPEALRATPQPRVDRDESAPEDLRERNVLRVVGSCPSEFVGEDEGALCKSCRPALVNLDLASQEARQRAVGKTLRDVSSKRGSSTTDGVSLHSRGGATSCSPPSASLARSPIRSSDSSTATLASTTSTWSLSGLRVSVSRPPQRLASAHPSRSRPNRPAAAPSCRSGARPHRRVRLVECRARGVLAQPPPCQRGCAFEKQLLGGHGPGFYLRQPRAPARGRAARSGSPVLRAARGRSRHASAAFRRRSLGGLTARRSPPRPREGIDPATCVTRAPDRQRRWAQARRRPLQLVGNGVRVVDVIACDELLARPRAPSGTFSPQRPPTPADGPPRPPSAPDPRTSRHLR